MESGTKGELELDIAKTRDCLDGIALMLHDIEEDLAAARSLDAAYRLRVLSDSIAACKKRIDSVYETIDAEPEE